MKSYVRFTKKIRNYAIASFLVPLIAINSCLLIYKYFGDLNVDLFRINLSHTSINELPKVIKLIKSFTSVGVGGSPSKS